MLNFQNTKQKITDAKVVLMFRLFNLYVNMNEIFY